MEQKPRTGTPEEKERLAGYIKDLALMARENEERVVHEELSIEQIIAINKRQHELQNAYMWVRDIKQNWFPEKIVAGNGTGAIRDLTKPRPFN